MLRRSLLIGLGVLAATACSSAPSVTSQAESAARETPAAAGAASTAPVTVSADAGRPAPIPPTALPETKPSQPVDAGVELKAETSETNMPSVLGPDGGVPQVPVSLPLTVQLEPAPGGFSETFELHLRPTDPAAEVHYTLDGSLPSRSSPSVEGPVEISKTTLVRALAVRGQSNGPVMNAGYFQLASDTRSFRSDLPLVVVDMLGAAAPDPLSQEYVNALLGVFERDREAGTAQLTGPAELTSRLGIKVRGRSTRKQAKHNYTIELRGSKDDDAPAPLLGMPAHGDWVLYAPFNYDRSLMHNALGYTISRSIDRWAPRTRFCEVFLVTGGQAATQASYQGIYVMTERIARGAERLDISKLRESDVSESARTGGYIVQRNEPDSLDEAFSAAGTQFLYVDPDEDEIQPEQSEYIASYLDAVMRAASDYEGRDPVTGEHYQELIDVPSFIDHHILQMLFKNPDAFSLSSYFHKDRGGRLMAGPLWDLDLGMGANDPWGQRSLVPEHWGTGTGTDLFYRSFWGPLFMHEEFERAYWERWRELLAGPFQMSTIRSTVAELQRELTQAEPRNSARWPSSAPRDNDLAAETEALADWLQARLAFIESQVGTLP